MEVNVLHRRMNRMVPVALILARSSRGLPDAHPVGRTVAGALKPIPLHERFEQMNRMSVTLLPVGGDLPGNLPKNMARQMIDADPRQDEETLVIGDQRQPPRALLGRPANPPIARSALPGRGSKEQAGQIDARATADQVTKVLADGPPIAEVVMAGQILLEHRIARLLGANDLDLEGAQRGQTARHWFRG